MTNPVTTYLNNTVMYRVMRHVLGSLALVAIGLSLVGLLSFPWLGLTLTLIVLIFVCGLVNVVLAKLFHAPVNQDSPWITALILFFLVQPTTSNLLMVALTAVLAMASKYVLVWRKRHMFNPAAIGVVLASLFGGPAIWWVATPILLPFVAVAVLLIIMKTRRYGLFILFVVASFITSLSQGLPVSAFFLYWPVIFFGGVMLTEPMTLPPSRYAQWIEAVAIGLLLMVPYRLGPLFGSPELTLVIANLLVFFIYQKSTVRLTLVERHQPAPGILDLSFTADRPLHHQAGQYVEWTLPHEKMDARGSRRTFTVASAPGDNIIRIGVRLAKEKGSSFKRALAELPIGGTLFASNVGGDFTLPKDHATKLVFIAGGIGITPFRSMAEEMLHAKTKRDAILLYCAASSADFVYHDLFVHAAEVGLTLHELTDRLDQAKVRELVPDVADRLFYLSGPPGMVNSYRKLLKQLGVARHRIHVDYFPGY